MRTAVFVALVLCLIAGVVLSVAPEEVANRLKKGESRCIDRCVKRAKLPSKVPTCMDFCAKLVTKEKFLKRVVNQIAAEEEEAAESTPESVLSDQIGQEAVQQQQEATKHLWELYYTNLAQLLSGKSTPSEGFQILPNAIELSAIREFGGDMMPLAALKTMMADDYDNMEILAREIMQVTKPGPFRQTNGVRLIDEYKSFLNHVAGVSSVPPLPNPSMLESAQRTLDYEAALNRCTDKYMSASPVFLERFPFDQYTGVFCRDVKMAENAMYAAIGKEQANVGGNPAYAAAVALGMAHGLYTPSTAFKKTQSIRAMEWDCVQAQNDPSIVYRSSPRSFEFQYNHNSWRNTAKSSSFSISVGYGPISVGFSQQKESAQGVDLTAVGGVKASFMDVKYIPLYPGDWYSSTAFKDFRYYPRAAGSPISRYFGETDGTLKLFPKGLYVAVNPTIGFAVQNNKKETFMKSTQQAVNVGASIMGFSLNLGYGKAAKVEEGKENGGKTMINISSQSCQPQLFAVENYYTY